MANSKFDSSQEKSLTSIMNEMQKSKLRQSILEKLVEKTSPPPQQSLNEQTSQKVKKTPVTGTEKYASTIREHVEKDNKNRQKVVSEKIDLLAGDESVTAAQLRQSNQELWNRVQTSLASLGGGGVGENDIPGIVQSSGLFVEAAGDSMTGALLSPQLRITPDSNDRNVLYYDTLDSSHELEAKDGYATDFDADWATPIIPSVGNKYYGLMYVPGGQNPSYSEGRYYASGDNGMWYTQDNYEGQWLPQTSIPKNYYGLMAHDGNGLWVMVKPEWQSVAQWSTDHGVTWQSTNTGSQGLTQYQNWEGLAFGNGVFVATAANNQGGSGSFLTVRWTANGSSWTDATGLRNIPYGKVTWSEEEQLFMIVAGRPASMDYGKTTVYTSTDGKAWDAQPPFADSDQYGLNEAAYGDGMWVGVGYNGNIQYSVNNGQFWESANFVADNPDFANENLSHVAYANGHFVARTSNGRKGAWSSNGRNWKPITSAPSSNVKDIKNLNGKIFTAGSGGRYGVTNGRVCWIEPEDATSGSLLFDGSQVATKENLKPLIDVVSDLAANASLGLIYQDSEPAGYDSYTPVSDGQMWFNSTTTNGQLLVRHNDSWSTGHSSAGSVDLSGFLPTSGGTLNGELKMANGQILLSSSGRNINVEFGTAGRLQYSGGTRFQWGNAYTTVFGTLNIQDGTDYVGNNVEGILDMHDNEIKNVPTPTADHHAANKSYADKVGVKYQAAAPAGASNGQMWFNSSTTDGQMFMRHNDSWVAI